MDDPMQNDAQQDPETARNLQQARLTSLQRVISDLFRAGTLPEAEQYAAIADLVTFIEDDPELESSMQAAVTDLMASPCDAIADQLLELASSPDHTPGTSLDIDEDLRSHIQSCPNCQTVLEDLEGPPDAFSASWGERAAASSAQTLDRYFQTRRMLYRVPLSESESVGAVIEGQVTAGELVPTLMGSAGSPRETTTDHDGGTYRRVLGDEDGVFTLLEYRTWQIEREAYTIELGLVDSETMAPLTAHHMEWTVAATLDGHPLKVQPSPDNANEWALADPVAAESLLRIVYDVSLVEPSPET